MNSTKTSCPECGNQVDSSLGHGCPVCQLKMAAHSEAIMEHTDNPMEPAELSKLFDDLDILEVIGTGGMGAVYSARQKKLDRVVALKVVRQDISNTEEFAHRFEREAKALARLNHANIVSIFDFGKVGDVYYYLMEYVDGTNLAELSHSQSLSPNESLEIVLQICKAMQYAHENGVVHRDIKPTNILINQQGVVKIADFGLAKLCSTGDPTTQLTQTRQVFGTPRYMAPEQIESSKEVDHRADIYSLGVVFYELLTGELPLGRFDPPSKKIQVDVSLDEIVLRALEKHPERRYQAAREFQTDISRYQENKPVPPIKSNQAMPVAIDGEPSMQPSWHVAVVTLIGAIFILIGLVFLPVTLSTFMVNSTFEPDTESAMLGSIFSLLIGLFLVVFGIRYRIKQLPQSIRMATNRRSPVERILGARTFVYLLGASCVVAIGLPWYQFGQRELIFVTGIHTWIGMALIIFCSLSLLLLVFVDIYEGTGIYFSAVTMFLGITVIVLTIVFWNQMPDNQMLHGMIRRSVRMDLGWFQGHSIGPVLEIVFGSLLVLVGFAVLIFSLNKSRKNWFNLQTNQ